MFLESCPRESHSWYINTRSASEPERISFEGTEPYTKPESQGRIFVMLGLILNFLAYAQFYLNCNDLMITYMLFLSEWL